MGRHHCGLRRGLRATVMPCWGHQEGGWACACAHVCVCVCAHMQRTQSTCTLKPMWTSPDAVSGPGRTGAPGPQWQVLPRSFWSPGGPRGPGAPWGRGRLLSRWVPDTLERKLPDEKAGGVPTSLSQHHTSSVLSCPLCCVSMSAYGHTHVTQHTCTRGSLYTSYVH